ncbi:hypothetical protein EV360DRAFT_49055 [Lentinula raphanica]|nr:hypothetical protein EV360DRAFT_49055 [Lentinula raphanica]
MLTQWLYLCHILIFSFIYSSSICLAQQGGSLQNISIANTSPQIDYTPFLCNVTDSGSFSAACSGGWQVLTLGGQTVVSTEGAGSQGANVIPQMFLQFPSALYFTTSASSNATFQIAVSAGSVSISASANSSIGEAAIVNLPENETTTLSLTFTPGQLPSRLDVGNITISVTNNSSISSILPTPTLPPSVSLPSFVSSTATASSTSSPSSTSSSQSSNHKQLVADAVGFTVGLGLGLTLITALVYYIWRRRRRRQDDTEWRPTGNTQGQRTFGFRRRTDNQDSRSTRWF